jgi:sigma-B regulation protein RsbU (phosphoserine phosphatase)
MMAVMAASDLDLTAALYEDAACGLMLTSANGLIERVNTTFCRWTGFEKAELEGKRRIQDLLTVGGRIYHQTHWAPLIKLQGSVAEVKIDLINASGRPLPMMLNASSRERGGSPVHELAFFLAEDRHKYETELLHARQRAEESLKAQLMLQAELRRADVRLKIALETANLYVWHVDVTTGEFTFDERCALLLGYPAPQPLSDEEFLRRVEPADRNELALASKAATHPSSGVYRCTYRINGIDGIQRTVVSSGRVQFSLEGQGEYFTGVLQDITELNEQKAQAESRALFAEQMVGIVSHDLRNPLQGISLAADILSKAVTPEKQARVVGGMRNAANRATRLVSDLLDFTQARIGRGLTVTIKPIQLHGVLSECIAELTPAFPGRELLYQSEIDPTTTCFADADRVHQMVGNLISNAMTYGAKDAPVIVSLALAPRGVALRVHNQGPPIPPDIIPKLFEPLTRGADTHSENRSIGLGLFIVKEIVKAHRAEVMVRSSVEHGTSFTILFPDEVA